MKVICIDSKNVIPLFIKEGNVYTVLQEIDNLFNIPVYLLVEGPQDVPYDKNRFAPLSDIDEKEFERNYNFQTV